LSTAAQLYEKIERLAVGNNLKGDSRSSELVICSIAMTICHYFRDIMTFACVRDWL